ncbi:MAG: hypothetical protein Q8O83_03125 [bacterium]|nr:hypothetical protein [bacterium]
MNDNKELIEYLDEKFTGIDERFSGVDERLVKIEITLDSLVENKADKSDVNTLTSAVDAYMKRADTYFQEMFANRKFKAQS